MLAGANDPNTPITSPDTPVPVPVPDPSPESRDTPIPTPVSPDTPVPAPSEYTITFDTNGGSEVPTLTVNADSVPVEPEAPSKAANIFVGWYRDNDTFAVPFTFGDDGDKVSGNITLYAQWIPDDPAGFAVDEAIAGVSITYAEGDNPGYVTRNLGLTSNSNGMAVTWTSGNPGLVSTAGNVARPLGSNARVILTASVSSGDFTAEKSFDLTVIRARTITPEQAKAEIASLDVADIELMNESNDNFEISYGESDDVVRAIEGQFTTVTVENADDALDAVQSVHEMLGINDPYAESHLLNVAKDEYGTQYSFSQVYPMTDYSGTAEASEGIPVYGRTLMVSANASGDTDFLASNYLPTDKMNDVYTQYTKSDAEGAALRNYAGETGLEVVSDDTRKIIYSLGDYEQNPVMAFTVHVTGETGSGEGVDDTVIVSGVDLSVISVITNNADWTTNESGKDELGISRTFLVTKKLLWSSLKVEMRMRDSGNPEVVMYSGKLEDSKLVKKSGSTWNDGQQVSFYVNMRPVIKWWKDKFNRNSLDNKGMTVKLVAHERKNNWRDNAYWSSGSEAIFMCDATDNSSKYRYSFAVAPDVLAHESTHAVIYYVTGGEFPYLNATGAIDEAYADIFGCMYEEEWQLGRSASDSVTMYIDKNQCLRDIAADTSVRALSSGTLADVPALYSHYKTVAQTDANDHNGVHTYSRLIAHAAYLMHQDYAGSANGLSWYQTRRIWYKSLFMGLDATSDFHTVRRNVLRAAQQIGVSAAKQLTIRKAFDAVGIYGHRGTVKGRVVDYSTGRKLSRGALVFVKDPSGLTEMSAKTSDDGTFTFTVDTGNYTVRIAPIDVSYMAYETKASVVSENDIADVWASLVKSGTGSLDVYVRNSSGSVSGVTLKLKNKTSGRTHSGTSDSYGKYTFIGVPSGYYTLRLSKSGYNNSEFEVTVPSEGTAYKALPILKSSYKYLAVLDFGGRNYLDLHLKAEAGGNKFHVYDETPKGYASNGSEVASFD